MLDVKEGCFAAQVVELIRCINQQSGPSLRVIKDAPQGMDDCITASLLADA